MTSLERMKALLAPSGIYRLEEGSGTAIELGLYAVWLDALEQELENLIDNCFLDSITRSGFDNYRTLYGLPEGLDWQPLRELVKKRLAITNRDFTPGGVKRCMAAGGFDVQLTEDFASNRVTVRILSDAGAFGTRAESEAFLRRCIPFGVGSIFLWG